MSEPGDDTFAAGLIVGYTETRRRVFDATPEEFDRYGNAPRWRWPLGGWSSLAAPGVLFMVGLVPPGDEKNSRRPVPVDLDDRGACRCGCGWQRTPTGWRAPGVMPERITLDVTLSGVG